MTSNGNTAHSVAPWRAASAYLYALDLDGPALAWEYLRRHPGYREEWLALGRGLNAERWGCDSGEDPQLDARNANPLWTCCTDDLLHVRPTGRPTPEDGKLFSLWLTPGRKRITHTGANLVMAAAAGPQWTRAVLASDLDDGAACHCTVPLGPRLRAELAQFEAQADAIQGRALTPRLARRAARAPVLHLRALQSLDAAQAGATHREIAEAVFDADAARARWSADSELRAQVRHLLSRAEGFMRGGYLALAGVRQARIGDPGDEPAT